MPQLIFVMLLTLTIQSGSDKEDDKQVYDRTQLWTTIASPDYKSCSERAAHEVEHFKAIWAIIADRTEPNNKLKDVKGICVGMNPNDKAPVN